MLTEKQLTEIKTIVEHPNLYSVIDLFDALKRVLISDTIDSNDSLRVTELETTLIEILKCDGDKYSSPEAAIDAVFALAFYGLPEEKRPKPPSNIVVSQIGLGAALGHK